MKKSFSKIIVLILIVSFEGIGLLAIGKTLASFSDTEMSNGNTFSVSTLDFSLHSGQGNFVPESKSQNMKPGDEVNRVIQVRNEGSLSFQYIARTEKISGDDDFCNALQLKADLEGKEKYSGSLMGFNFPAIEMITPPGIDTWHFKVSLPEDSDFQNKICQIKFVFDSWQTLPSGFFDQEEIESYFASTSSNSDDNPGELLIDEEITNNNPEEGISEETPEEPVDETTNSENTSFVEEETSVEQELPTIENENLSIEEPVNEEAVVEEGSTDEEQVVEESTGEEVTPVPSIEDGATGQATEEKQ